MEAVILRQSLQLQTKVSTRPGEVVGKRHWTAPQKQVAVAVLLSLPPLTPSEGSGNLPELMLTGRRWCEGLEVMLRVVEVTGC